MRMILQIFNSHSHQSFSTRICLYVILIPIIPFDSFVRFSHVNEFERRVKFRFEIDYKYF